jgi:predicted GNAT family acetyltransferase
MATTIIDNTEASRVEMSLDGTLAGFVEYHNSGGVIAYLHTEIKPEFGGRGLATELIRATLDLAREAGLAVEPFCPFVRGFIRKNPQYRDLVPEAQWERFDLTPS